MVLLLLLLLLLLFLLLVLVLVMALVQVLLSSTSTGMSTTYSGNRRCDVGKSTHQGQPDAVRQHVHSFCRRPGFWVGHLQLSHSFGRQRVAQCRLRLQDHISDL